MFSEHNKQDYFQSGTETAMKGSLMKSPDYTNKIAAPKFDAEIDFNAEVGTPEVDRQFIGHILTESGALPEVSPKPGGNSNGMKKAAKKSY